LVVSSVAELRSRFDLAVNQSATVSLFLDPAVRFELGGAPLYCGSAAAIELWSGDSGAYIDGQVLSRLFELDGHCRLSLTGLRLTGGKALGLHGGAAIISGSAALIVLRTHVSGCTAERGAAFKISGSGVLTIADSKISDCHAFHSGGAVHADMDATVGLSGVSVSDCSADVNGGALAMLGSASLFISATAAADLTNNNTAKWNHAGFSPAAALLSALPSLRRGARSEPSSSIEDDAVHASQQESSHAHTDALARPSPTGRSGRVVPSSRERGVLFI
jgi:hypothetical protein